MCGSSLALEGRLTPELEFRIRDWLGPGDGSAEASALGSLTVVAGRSPTCLTQVEDTVTRTVRDHVDVWLALLTDWMLANWWRLRWEPRPEHPTDSWRRAHCLAAIGGGYAWPAIEFASDGENIEVAASPDRVPDAAGIRYLARVRVEIPAAAIERATMRLAQEVRAGHDPGEAPAGWVERVAALEQVAGAPGVEEVLAVLPSLPQGLASAEEAIEALRRSRTTVDLECAEARSPAVAWRWEGRSRTAADCGALRFA